jgi:hypothetical protein
MAPELLDEYSTHMLAVTAIATSSADDQKK